MTRFDESRFAVRVVQAFALILVMAWASIADAAISLRLAQNQIGDYDTNYPNGDKPVVSCTIPDGWTLLKKGTADGEVCNDEGDFQITASGADDEGDELLAYQSCGSSNCQVVGQVPLSWSGHSETFTSFGVEICEGTGDSAWCIKSWVTPDGRVRCKGGAPGPDDYTVTGSANQLPEYLGVAHDDSADLVYCAQSENGTDWTAFGTFARNLSEPNIGGVFGTSHDANATTTATLTGVSLSTTLTIVADEEPPEPEAPEQTSSIANQSGTSGVAFSLNISGNFTGETSYTATPLPAGSGLSFNTATGVLSGTPDADDVSASPYNVPMCAVNAVGPTCQQVQFTFATAPAGGDVFTIPDVGDTTDSTFNCASASGANGASWASIRTSGTGTTPGAGDVIEITSGTRGDTVFDNCRGTAGSVLTFRKTASATRLTFNVNNSSSGAGGLMFRDTARVVVDGLVNWTGHSGGCGADVTATGISSTPLTDCGILIDGTSANGLRLRGERRFITLRGIEIDGNWSGPPNAGGMGYGFFANDQQYCASDHPGEFLEGLDFTDNYVHDTRAAHTYIGINVPVTCDGQPDNTLDVRDLLIERNYFADSGSNGIHIKSVVGSDPMEAIARHNYVTRIGGSPSGTAEGANNRPISCYEASCFIEKNVVHTTIQDDPEGPGITCGIQHRPAADGLQVCRVQNNVIIDVRGHGLNAVRQASGAQGTTSQMRLEYDNNTVVNQGGNCANVASTVTDGYIRNTLCADANTTIGGNLNEQGNGGGAIGSQGFQNSAADDYRLTTGSPNKNSGTNTSCPTEDFIGVTRPQGGLCDRGAYEFDE